MKTKTEKVIAAGTIALTGVAIASLCPPLAFHIKIATFAGISKVLHS